MTKVSVQKSTFLIIFGPIQALDIVDNFVKFHLTLALVLYKDINPDYRYLLCTHLDKSW